MPPATKGFNTTMTPDQQLALTVAQAVATTLAPVAGAVTALIDLQEKMVGGNEATHNRLRLIEERLAIHRNPADQLARQVTARRRGLRGGEA